MVVNFVPATVVQIYTVQRALYRMAGNIGGDLNLAIWWPSVGSPNFKSPKLLPTKM